MPIRRLQYCVDNDWKNSLAQKYTAVMNPSTGEQIAEAPVCTRAEVEAAVASCRAAFPGWAAKPVAVRTQVLFKFRELANSHFEELAVLLASEMGKNLDEARGDVFKVIEACELAVGAPLELQGHSLMEATRSHDITSYREPVGVFLGIAPYNFPAMIPFGWFIPSCIVSGNCMVLKAATMVPQTGMRLLELLIEAGLPKGVVNLVTCSREELTALLEHKDIDGITFVGSESVGKKIYSVAAPQQGATLVLDGRNCRPKGFENGFFVGPTIFDHVKPGMSVGDDEIFGPVLCVKRCKDFEEGLALMNANPFANGSSIFTTSGHYAREFAQRTHGGMVGVNVGIPVPLGFFPFSGHKRSFYGDLYVLGRDGMRFYTQIKTVTTKWISPAESHEAKVSTWEGTINRDL